MLEKNLEKLWNDIDSLQSDTEMVNSSELYDKLEDIKKGIENASWDLQNLVSAVDHLRKTHLSRK
jgi:hypothetical protein